MLHYAPQHLKKSILWCTVRKTSKQSRLHMWTNGLTNAYTQTYTCMCMHACAHTHTYTHWHTTVFSCL